MPYISPEDIASPRNRFGGLVELIYAGAENEMSVARIRWRNDQDEEDRERVAIRWNGDDERPLGNPVARGHATWFIVAEYAEAGILQAAREAAEKSPNSLVSKYREMARDLAREREAEEWTEGLIGDASSQG